MNEQLITFETAKLAKEKGFDIKTHNCFAETKEHFLFDHRSNEDIKFDYIPPQKD